MTVYVRLMKINQSSIKKFDSKNQKQEIKSKLLTEAIAIKELYQDKQQQQLINQLGKKIQQRVNKGTFNEKFLTEITYDLKSHNISAEDTEKLITNLICLSKHEHIYIGDQTKFNYFGTNKTRSINNFINHQLTTNINYHSIDNTELIHDLSLSSILFTIGHIYKNNGFIEKSKEILRGVNKNILTSVTNGYCDLWNKRLLELNLNENTAEKSEDPELNLMKNKMLHYLSLEKDRNESVKHFPMPHFTKI